MNAFLGISAYYHDSAAALVVDGKLVAAAQEERFTRKKFDASFPYNAARFVLEESGIDFAQLSAVVFYDKPFLKFERLLETYHAFAPKGLTSFLSAIPVWVKEKLFMKRLLHQELAKLGNKKIPLLFPEHHLSHAASAFYPSPFKESAILTIDGVGEWATTTIGHGKGNSISILKELHFPHSAGLLYSAFTGYLGFKVNSGEYKLMGLAPYGDLQNNQTQEFKKKIVTDLVDVRSDGSILLNMDYFDFATGLTMCNDRKWGRLFGFSPRKSESQISPQHMNLALAIQQVTEDILLKLFQTTRSLTRCNNLVMAGGVALNCVANGKLQNAGIFKNIWVQPAAGDAGGAIGAAFIGHHIWKGNNRTCVSGTDQMNGSYLGPEYPAKSIKKVLTKYNAPYQYFEEYKELSKKVAEFLADGKVVGWFQGKMEFGPRALGNRSILGDARNPDMQKKMNLKIKYRESFRPFAPAVLEEDVSTYFEYSGNSPYMLFVANVNKDRQFPLPENVTSDNMFIKLYHKRSDLPAITHVDYSARLQTVSKTTNPRFWDLLNEFKQQTGYGILVNTSFNVRGEPIVCTPEDAYRCFMRTEIDYSVVGDYLLKKEKQEALKQDSNWKEGFALD